MIAGKDQQRFDPPAPQVRQHLPNGVRRSLKPVRTVVRLLGRQYLDKTRRKARKPYVREMCRFSDAELYCVRTKICVISD